MEQVFAKEIDFGPEVRVNVSPRRAGFYGKLPYRIPVGTVRYAPVGPIRRNLARNLGLAIGLLIAFAVWMLRP